MSLNTIKLKFLKSLYPYRQGEIVNFRKDKYNDFIKKYTEEVKNIDKKENKKTLKKSNKSEENDNKKENKAILSNKNTK